jgi:hypothetical protein
MRKWILILILATVAPWSWCEAQLTGPQMRVFSRVKRANSWLGAGLLLEGVGLLATIASIVPAMGSEDPALPFFVSVGVFGVGILVQAVTTTAIGTGSTRLSRLIDQEGSGAPRPTAATAWAFVSAGTMAGSFLLAGVDPTGESTGTIGGMLGLTSIVSAGVTYFAVNVYGAEIGWRDFEHPRQSAVTDRRTQPTESAPSAGGLLQIAPGLASQHQGEGCFEMPTSGWCTLTAGSWLAAQTQISPLSSSACPGHRLAFRPIETAADDHGE